MLSYFPDPYPDEILYSVLARYHVRSGNTSMKSTLDELFGSSTVISTLDLPSHIDALCARLPKGSLLMPNELISLHTLLPFYAPFMPERRTDRIKNLMLGVNGNAIHMTIGIMAGGFPAKTEICFCQNCFEDDIARFGEPYWHRVHQAPGVLVCPLHNRVLNSYTKGISSRHQYLPAPLTIHSSDLNLLLTCYKDLSAQTREHLTQISTDVSDLLSLSYNPLFYKSKHNVLTRLKEMEFATPKGQIRQDRVSEQFTLFYGQELLSLLHSNVMGEYSWIRYATRKEGRAIHPIRYLMLLRFLYGSLNDYLSVRKTIYAPFGSGPWPCLNKGAAHFKTDVITECNISLCSDTKRPVGSFQCSCGFCYSRRGPDQQETDRNKVGRIKAFGKVWFTKLEELMSQSGRSLRATARSLGVDTKTVIKYAEKLKHGDKLEDKHQSSLEVVEVPPHPKQNLSLRNNKDKNDHKGNNINWELRDLEISVLVEEVCKRLLNDTESKPIRLTWSLVARRIGKVSLMQQESNRLIVTKAVFDQYKESIEQFQIRRIKWVAGVLRERDMLLKRWEIQRMAGLKSGYGAEVANEITKQLIVNNMHFNATEGQQWLH